VHGREYHDRLPHATEERSEKRAELRECTQAEEIKKKLSLGNFMDQTRSHTRYALNVYPSSCISATHITVRSRREQGADRGDAGALGDC